MGALKTQGRVGLDHVAVSRIVEQLSTAEERAGLRQRDWPGGLAAYVYSARGSPAWVLAAPTVPLAGPNPLALKGFPSMVQTPAMDAVIGVLGSEGVDRGPAPLAMVLVEAMIERGANTPRAPLIDEVHEFERLPVASRVDY